MTSLDELKQKVLEVDLSVNNPKVQKLIEENIVSLVREYERQEEIRNEIEEYNKQETVKKRSCPKYIPDEITLSDRKYSPQQMLEHVRAKDEDGMYILKTIEERALNSPKKNLSTKGLKESLVEMVTEEKADKVALQCICGKHTVTHRDLLQGFVDFNMDVSNFADMIYSMALFSLYDNPDIDKPKPSPQPKKGLFGRIVDYFRDQS